MPTVPLCAPEWTRHAEPADVAPPRYPIPPRVGVAFISDRPADLYLAGAQASYAAQVLAHDRHVDWAGAAVVDDAAHVLGMAGAVRSAWAWARRMRLDYLWHWEEDFVAVRPVPTSPIVDVLERSPYLASVTLTRGPWNTAERRAGGIIAANPDAYRPMFGMDGARWEHHREVFSLNPSLIPRRTFERWDDIYPDGNEAEATARLLADGQTFALWGNRTEAPQVQHLGAQRGEGWRL